jgi:hypothetical protein
MNNELPAIEALRESFKRVYDGPDQLQKEYDIAREAKQMGIELETYRRLYELRNEEPNDPYPKPKKWWYAPRDWTKWFFHLQRKKKLALLRKGGFKLVQSGVIISIVLALGRYFWESPKRQKLAQYQAWQMVNSAQGQAVSAGRLEALQDLNNDRISLEGLDAKEAHLRFINLQGANLQYAQFQNAKLTGANLQRTHLRFAKFQEANLSGVNFYKADLRKADLKDAQIDLLERDSKKIPSNFHEANLENASLKCADLKDAVFLKANLNKADLRGAKNLTPAQVKLAKNWQYAYYNPEFQKQLSLSLQTLEKIQCKS